MADSLLTPTEIVRRSLAILHEESVFLQSIDRQYDNRFANSGASVSGKIGPNLQIRDTVKFVTRTGATWTNQDVTERSRTLTVSTLKGIDWDFDEVDLALTIDEFADRYLKPAMSQLAAELEYSAFLMAEDVWNQVGTIGTTPATTTPFLDASKTLNKALAPRSDRYCLINPDAEAASIGGLQALFNSQKVIADQFETGQIGNFAGFKIKTTSLIRNHTVGPLGGTPLVNGASQGISAGHSYTTTLVTDGWTAAAASRLANGDIITLAGVNSVHPESRQSTGVLQQFRVNAVSSDGAGNLSAVISPAIITGGAYQTVSGSPADNAAITVLGTANVVHPMNLGFHKSAFTWVSADLELPKGMDMASKSTIDGVSMRFLRGYDIINNRRICRFDILSGQLAQRPDLAVRIAG
jgi:P22 coat protein - gene protein 5